MLKRSRMGCGAVELNKQAGDMEMPKSPGFCLLGKESLGR